MGRGVRGKSGARRWKTAVRKGGGYGDGEEVRWEGVIRSGRIEIKGVVGRRKRRG